MRQGEGLAGQRGAEREPGWRRFLALAGLSALAAGRGAAAARTEQPPPGPLTADNRSLRRAWQAAERGNACGTGWEQPRAGSDNRLGSASPSGMRIISWRLLGTGCAGAQGTSGTADPRPPWAVAAASLRPGTEAARISLRVQKSMCKLIS